MLKNTYFYPLVLTPQVAAWPGWSLSKVESQELLPRILQECRGPRTGACSAVFPVISMELDQKVEQLEHKLVPVWSTAVSMRSMRLLHHCAGPLDGFHNLRAMDALDWVVLAVHSACCKILVTCLAMTNLTYSLSGFACWRCFQTSRIVLMWPFVSCQASLTQPALFEVHPC